MKKDSRSRSKSEAKYSKHSDWSKSARSPRGEIGSRVLRSKSAGSQELKPEENGHAAEEKNPEAPVEEQTPAEMNEKE